MRYINRHYLSIIYLYGPVWGVKVYNKHYKQKSRLTHATDPQGNDHTLKRTRYTAMTWWQ